MTDVKWNLAVAGAEAAANGFRLVSTAVRDTSGATGGLKRAQDEMAKKQAALTRALSAQIQGFGALGGAVGQVGAVLGRVRPDLSRFGQALGQAGQSVSAVATALAAPTPGSVVTALVSVATTVVDVIDAWRAYERESTESVRAVQAATRDTIGTVRDLTAALRDASTRRSEAAHVAMGLGSQLEQQAFVIESQKEQDAVRVRLRILEGEEERLIRGQGGLYQAQRTRIDEETRALRARSAALGEETDARRQLALTASAEESEGAREALSGDPQTRRGGGGNRLAEAQRRYDAALASGLAQEARARAAWDAEQDRLKEARHAAEMERQNIEATVRDRIKAQEEAIHTARMSAMAEESALALEGFEKRQATIEAERQLALEAADQVRDQAQSVLGPVVQGLSQATAEVIAGARSADEAFQGLLASFLGMIAERAAIEAAAAYAQAIGKFAQEDYPGGALSLAAGAAWTGVAIAAGAGAIALQPPSEATPASPQSGQGTRSGGGGGDVTVIVSGTVVSAGNIEGQQELGRTFEGFIRSAQRRDGRAA